MRKLILTFLNIWIIVILISLNVNGDIESDLFIKHTFNDSAISGTDYLDDSGNNYECAITGTLNSVAGIPYDLGEAIYIDGTNDYCAFDNTDFDSLAQSDATISCWVNMTETGIRQHIWDMQGDVQVNLFYHNTNGYGMYFGSNIGTMFSYNDSMGYWVMLTGVIKENTYESFYINGELKVNRSITDGIDADTQAGSFIGTGYDGNNDFNGTIDDCRIYKRTFTGEEVVALFDATKEYQEPECTPYLLNTSYSEWANTSNCIIPYLSYFYNQSRFLIQYDNNSCEESENETFYDYRNQTCNMFLENTEYEVNKMIIALSLIYIAFLVLGYWLITTGNSLSGISLIFLTFGIDLYFIQKFYTELVVVTTNSWENTFVYIFGIYLFLWILVKFIFPFTIKQSKNKVLH